MSVYNGPTFKNKQAPAINETNLNNMVQGIEDAHSELIAHQQATTLDHADGSVKAQHLAADSVTDVKIGTRTLNDTLSPVNSGQLGAVLSGMAAQIKRITGSDTWLAMPNASLASLNNTKLDTATANTLYAAINHTHSEYLGISAQAADSAKLEGHNSSYFAISTHNHDGQYIPYVNYSNGFLKYTDGVLSWEYVGQSSDADTVDGYHASAFALAGHNHNDLYLGLSARAMDSAQLEGYTASYFATADHNHDTTYLGISAKAADSDLLDSHDSSYFATSTHNHDATYLGINANAVSASKWATARTITVSGAETGSVSLDGSANATLSLTVNHNHDATYLKLAGGTLTGTLTGTTFTGTAFNTTGNGQLFDANGLATNYIADIRYNAGAFTWFEYHRNLLFNADKINTITWNDATGLNNQASIWSPEGNDHFMTIDMSTAADPLVVTCTGFNWTTTNAGAIRAFMQWHGSQGYNTVQFEILDKNDTWTVLSIWKTFGGYFHVTNTTTAAGVGSNYPFKGLRVTMTGKTVTTGNRYIYAIGLYAPRADAWPYLAKINGSTLYGNYNWMNGSYPQVNGVNVALSNHNHDATYLGINANAVSASKWATARTITVSGAETGSVSLDGSANVGLSLTVNHNHDAAYLGISANAVSASKWATARTITVTGADTGSVSLDGSANATLNLTLNHNHDAAYLGIAAKAADSDLLDSHDSSYFAVATHNHDATYLGISANAVSASKWAAARTITVTGADTGSVSIDGSANATLNLTLNHNHDAAYLGIAAKAADSDLLDSHDSSYFATAAHNHDATYLGINANAVSASKWATARTITVTGADTGSVSLDGSANVSLALTINHNHDATYVKLSGSSMTGDLDMATHRVMNLPAPSTGTDVATKDYVDSKIQGIDWQESVKDILNTPPASPASGDRYIVGTSPTGAWVGHGNQIAWYNVSAWQFIAITEGAATWVEDEDTNYTWNGTAWAKFGSTVTHNNLAGLQGTGVDYYHLSSAQYTGLTSGADTTLHIHDSRYFTETEADARFAAIGHNHNATYLGISAQAVDSNKLNGQLASYYSVATHNHDAAYLGINANAASASKWATARTITVTGADTGSVSIDGSANVSLALTVNHNHDAAYLGIGANAVSASKWATARTITVTGAETGSVSIDGSANATLNLTLNHNHDSAYLGIAATAADSAKLGGVAAASYSLTSHNHDAAYIGKITNVHGLLHNDGTGVMSYVAESTFATAGHNHDAAYLGIAAKAADSELLDSHDSTYFATADHNHDAAYIAKIANVHGLLHNDGTGVMSYVAESTFATSGHNHDAAYLGIAAKAADSELLDSHDSTYFATATHNHDAAYLGISAQAVDSNKLNGQLASYYSVATHNHDATYLGINANAVSASKWATARTITVSGAETGSVSIDGSADVSLALTVNHNHNSSYPLRGINSYSIQAADDRTVIPSQVSDVTKDVYFHFGKVGADNSGNYADCITLSTYSDNSGGNINELVFDKNTGNVYHKYGAWGSATWSWSRKIWDDGNDGSGSGLDADLLDSHEAAYFATAAHNHDATYLGIAAQAADSAKWNGKAMPANVDGILHNDGTGVLSWLAESTFATAGHNHDATYLKLAGGTVTGATVFDMSTGLYSRVLSSSGTAYLGGLMFDQNSTNAFKISSVNTGGNTGSFCIDYVSRASPETRIGTPVFSFNNNTVWHAGNFTPSSKLDASANAVSASKWATARTITVNGSDTGSVSIDGSTNVTLTLTTNHTHDDRYYTETESDAKYATIGHNHDATYLPKIANAVGYLKNDGSGNYSWLPMSLSVGECAPIASVIYLACVTVPVSYLEANGASLLRTDYPDLFTAIGTTYGSADGTHFNLPDLRGVFIRGLDDGRGLDTGRTIGTFQNDDLKAHTHSNVVAGATIFGITLGSGNNVLATGTTGSTGGSETRPINVALMPCIKYTKNDLTLDTIAATGFFVQNGSYYSLLKADAQSANITYTLPASITAGAFLKTDGSGNLSWSAVDMTPYLPKAGGSMTGALTVNGQVLAQGGRGVAAYHNNTTIEVTGDATQPPRIGFHYTGNMEGVLEGNSTGWRRLDLYDSQGAKLGLHATGVISSDAGFQVNGSSYKAIGDTTQLTSIGLNASTSNYQAATDGFVTVRSSNWGNGGCTTSLYTDSSSNPSTNVATTSSNPYGGDWQMMTVPVKAGNYYRVSTNSNGATQNGTTYIYWTPNP